MISMYEGGIVIVKATKVIVIGHYSDQTISAQAHTEAESLADHLIGNSS